MEVIINYNNEDIKVEDKINYEEVDTVIKKDKNTCSKNKLSVKDNVQLEDTIKIEKNDFFGDNNG